MTKYYVYEIPGVKVGCTNNFERRQKQQSKIGKMILLETYSTIEAASYREKQLQVEKGYDVDRVPYKHTPARIKAAAKPNIRKKAMKSINWEERNKKLKENARKGNLRNNKKTSKPVYQYTIDGKYLKTYPSTMEAQRQLKITGIAEAIRGVTQKTAGGYIWKHSKT